jgi:epoxide hydrolase 4
MALRRPGSTLYPPTDDDPGACALGIDPAKVQVTMPTLVLWGERDRHLLPVCLDGLEQVVPNLHVQRVPEASHWIVHEQPAMVNRMLRVFIAAAAEH